MGIFLVDIREKMKLTKDDMASILGVSRMNVYNLENKDNVPFKYYKKIEHLLSEKEKKYILQNYYSMSFDDETANVVETDAEMSKKHYNNRIVVYNNIDDFLLNFDKNEYNNDLNKLVVTNAADENCKVFVCRLDKNKIFIDVTKRTPSTKDGLYVVKNTLSDKVISFLAHIRINELTGQVVMKLENGTETAMSETCKIIGRVISKIVSV